MVEYNTYLNKIVIICILYISLGLSLFAQDTVKLLPTGRSLPDMLPADEFMYVSPVDDPNITTSETPRQVPPPEFEPTQKNIAPDLKNITKGEAIKQIPPNQKMDVPLNVEGTYPSSNPIFKPDSSPRKISETPSLTPEPNQTMEGMPRALEAAPASGISIPPGQEVGPMMYPEPSSDVIIPPYGSVTTEPKGEVPPAAGRTESPPRTRTSEWRFTLNPTTDKFAPPDGTEQISPLASQAKEIEKKEPIRELKKQVVIETPQPQQELSSKVIDVLNGRYIQVGSYHNMNIAQQSALTLINKIDDALLKEKVVVYKPASSQYCKVVVGPFQITEIGVNLYEIRKYGYADAYTIKKP